jgi:hypothetical protein
MTDLHPYVNDPSTREDWMDAVDALPIDRLQQLARAHYATVSSLSYEDADDMDPIDCGALCDDIDTFEELGLPLTDKMVEFRDDWREDDEDDEDDGGSAGSLVLVLPVEG